MRMILLTCWLVVPVAAAAYHFGPGQERMLMDDAQGFIAQAQQQAANEQWAEAEANYEKALEILPSEKVHEQRRVRVERAKAQMFVKSCQPHIKT